MPLSTPPALPLFASAEGNCEAWLSSYFHYIMAVSKTGEVLPTLYVGLPLSSRILQGTTGYFLPLAAFSLRLVFIMVLAIC